MLPAAMKLFGILMTGAAAMVSCNVFRRMQARDVSRPAAVFR
jgi:hypothetical protein